MFKQHIAKPVVKQKAVFDSDSSNSLGSEGHPKKLQAKNDATSLGEWQSCSDEEEKVPF